MSLFNNQFNDPKTEERYQALYEQTLLQSLKGGLISSYVLWSVTILIINLTATAQRLELSLIIGITIVPYFTLLLVNIKKNWVKNNIEVLLASTNTLAGLLFVYVLYAMPATSNYILPGLLFIIFFAMLSYQFKPKTILLAALPYVLLYIGLSIGSNLFNQVEIIVQSSFSISVILFATYIASTIEQSNRKKFIQELKISEQAQALSEKNEEIHDSITYAQRIQAAIMPPLAKTKEHLPNSFILYKPKDIVAGDFYWMQQVESKTLFAAADCTGHGVPGAMVSVICNNALNRSVRDFKLLEPGKILDKTRELVIQEFEKSEEEVKDGMDIALCCLDGNTLTFAGAHNSLWILRNDEIIEVKGDRQPIGKFDFQTTFNTQVLNLEKNDLLYVFSDGYADQFGGEKGKKYKTGKLKKFLISIQHQPMEDQKKLLFEEFEKWRGNIEQIDDVCVIGVRI